MLPRYKRNNPITNKENEREYNEYRNKQEASKVIMLVLFVIVFIGILSSFC